MASLGKNPVWSNLTPGSADILGPSYSYVDNIPGPSTLGVGTDGTMGQVFTNTGAITEYIKYMITGPAMGNQYFVNTGGTCVATDGSTQSRHNYINNIANGADLVPANMRSEMSFLSDDLNGLIPGILGDVEGLDPVYLMTALAADSTPACDCYTCPVSGGTESHFLTPSLSPDFDPDVCSKVDVSACIGGTTTESFTNQSSSTMLPTILAFGALILLRLSC
jgi:hypothetical protein